MSFVGLYTGLSGIRAGQAGLDTASNNIANANTPGYTRQRVEFTAAHSFNSPYGPVGTGVKVEDVARLRDGFLDARYRSAVGDGAAAQVRSEFLTSMERLSGEPELGLSSKIGELWAAMEDWSNDPNADASRRAVLNELATVSETFRGTAAAWDQLGEDTAQQLDVVLGEVNDLLETLHKDFNVRLANADMARVGPGLLDQRDKLLDRLSELTGATVSYNEDNTVTVRVGGEALLDYENHPEGPATVVLGESAAHGGDIRIGVLAPDAVAGDDAIVVDASGELAGLHRVVHEDLPAWRDRLDMLANTLMTAINEQNAAGALLADGTAGGDLLSGDGAADMALVSNDIAALAAGALDGGGAAPAPHDGTNARAFADLRTARLTPAGGGDPATFEALLSEQIVGLAGAVRSSEATTEAARGVATGAHLARASQHGVSIDEEMVDLVRFQRALEANARVMTTVDQTLDVLVNRVGIVGR